MLTNISVNTIKMKSVSINAKKKFMSQYVTPKFTFILKDIDFC